MQCCYMPNITYLECIFVFSLYYTWHCILHTSCIYTCNLACLFIKCKFLHIINLIYFVPHIILTIGGTSQTKATDHRMWVWPWAGNITVPRSQYPSDHSDWAESSAQTTARRGQWTKCCWKTSNNHGVSYDVQTSSVNNSFLINFQFTFHFFMYDMQN